MTFFAVFMLGFLVMQMLVMGPRRERITFACTVGLMAAIMSTAHASLPPMPGDDDLQTSGLLITSHGVFITSQTIETTRMPYKRYDCGSESTGVMLLRAVRY